MTNNSIRLSEILQQDTIFKNISIQHNPINTYPLEDRLDDDDSYIVYWGN